jgi:hypothetical protein
MTNLIPAAVVVKPLTVTWIISTSLNGTYAIDRQLQFKIAAEMVSILANGMFTNGLMSRDWPTADGNFRLMTVAQFKAFAAAVALYIDQSLSAYAMAAAVAAAGNDPTTFAPPQRPYGLAPASP